MSLQVWLPLIKDTLNQGVSSTSGSLNHSSITYETGKIGNAIRINNYVTSTATYSGIADKLNWSICVWLKLSTSDPTPSYQDFFTIGMNNNGATSGGFRFEHTNIAGNFQIVTTKLTTWGPNTNGYYTFYSNTSACKDTWGHIVVTNDGTNYKTYINGTLASTIAISTFTETTSKLTGTLTLGLAGTYCWLNDLRIYDHALSPKEIKEISKGLVCHYPLESSYGGQDNLFKASVAIGQSNCTVDRSQASGYLIKLPASSGVSIFNSKDLITNGVFSSSDYGKTFTVSFTAWSDANTNLASDLNPDTYGGSLGMPNDTAVINVFTTPTRLVYTGTITNSSGAMVNNTIFRFWHYGSDKGYNNTNIYITNIKVEVGNKVTPWCPNASDNNYMSSNIEYDTSGYCNHGTKSGTITYNSDTPRYSVSTVFDGTSSGIEIQSSVFPVVLNGPFTASMWVYDQETGGR